jgi:hypothetical protein
MPVFSSDRMSVMPGTLTTAHSLEDIRDTLLARRPTAGTLEPAWGSPEGTTHLLGSRYVTPPVGIPEVKEADSRFPRRIHMRYFYYARSRDLEKHAEADASERDVNILNAVDLIISQVQADAQYQLLFSTTNTQLLNKGALGSIIESLAAVDKSSAARLQDSPIQFENADLFLWLMVRTRDAPDLGEGLVLTRIDAVSGQDQSDRITALSKGVDFERPSFLVAVAEAERLGPMRVRLKEAELDARFGFDLYTSGAFSPQKANTHYRSPSEDLEEGLRATMDLAFDIIPRLLEAYRGDSTWSEVGRTREIVAAAKALIARYQKMYPDMRSAEEAGESLDLDEPVKNSKP